MAKLSDRYAAALFELFMESGAPADYITHATLLRDTLSEEKCQQVVLHPHIHSDEKCAFFKNAFEGQVHSSLLSFLYLATKKSREKFLVPALSVLIEKIDRHNNKITAGVISATVLNAGQIAVLKSTLSKKLQKEVELELKVEPSVIGGLIIHVDGYVINRTVKGQLHEMKVSMEKEYGA